VSTHCFDGKDSCLAVVFKANEQETTMREAKLEENGVQSMLKEGHFLNVFRCWVNDRVCTS
jgi:hypothetical protein